MNSKAAEAAAAAGLVKGKNESANAKMQTSTLKIRAFSGDL